MSVFDRTRSGFTFSLVFPCREKSQLVLNVQNKIQKCKACMLQQVSVSSGCNLHWAWGTSTSCWIGVACFTGRSEHQCLTKAWVVTWSVTKRGSDLYKELKEWNTMVFAILMWKIWIGIRFMCRHNLVEIPHKDNKIGCVCLCERLRDYFFTHLTLVSSSCFLVTVSSDSSDQLIIHSSEETKTKDTHSTSWSLFACLCVWVCVHVWVEHLTLSFRLLSGRCHLLCSGRALHIGISYQRKVKCKQHSIINFLSLY